MDKTLGILSDISLNPEKETYRSQLVGSHIASRDFASEIIKSELCEVQFFVPGTDVSGYEAEVKRILSGRTAQRVEVNSIYDLQTQLSQKDFMAFHNPLSVDLDTLSYVRSRFAKRAFPLTCVTHGLSHRFMIWERYARFLTIPLLPCDSIVCTSEAAKAALANNLAQVASGFAEAGFTIPKVPFRMDVIPLGIDTQLYKPRDKAEVRRLLGLPLDKKLILCFGRIDHATKADLNPLLIAFNALFARGQQDAVLVIAGNVAPPEVAIIRQTAAHLGCGNRLIIRPNPSVIEGPLYYSSADIFVSISDTIQESFGLSPLEAMSSGLPVVVSDWSGYKETVQHEINGFRVTTYWGGCDKDVCDFSPLHNPVEDHLHLGQSVAVDVGQLTEFLITLFEQPRQMRRDGKSRPRACVGAV